MKEIMNFLVSEEVVMVYAIIGIAILLCLMVYGIEKKFGNRKQKQNTKELNTLVEQLEEVEKKEEMLKPAINDVNMLEEAIKTESIEVEKDSKEEKKLENSKVLLEEQNPVTTIDELEEIAMIEEKEQEKPVIEPPKAEEIQYENIEPSQTDAQKELEKLTEELKNANEVIENIELTEFEAEQEASAIISLEELMAKRDTLYEKNEIRQYEEESELPISLQEFEEHMKKMQELNESSIECEEVIMTPTEEEEPKESVVQLSMPLENIEESVQPKKMEEVYQGEHKFKSSPIISPIFGIEKDGNQNELALENTANYEKLDEEIRKTNEFIMTLKELQEKLP